MAIAVRSHTETDSSYPSSTSIVMAKATGAVEGDLLLTCIHISVSGTINSVPSGWTLLRHQGFTGQDMYVYWKIAGASEPSTYTFGFSGACRKAGTMYAFSGVNQSAPIGVDTFGTATEVFSSTLVTFTSTLTPTLGNCLLFAYLPSTTVSYDNSFAITNNNPSWTTYNTSAYGGDAIYAYTAYSSIRSGTTATGDITYRKASTGSSINAICEMICIVEESVSISDTTTVTDDITIQRQLNTTIIDTTTVTDTVTSEKGRTWTNQSKNNSTTWTNQSKS